MPIEPTNPVGIPFSERVNDVDRGLSKFSKFIDKFVPRALTKPGMSEKIILGKAILVSLVKAIIGCTVAFVASSLGILGAAAAFTIWPFFCATALLVGVLSVMLCFLLKREDIAAQVGCCLVASIGLAPITIAGIGLSVGVVALALTHQSILNEFSN